MAPSSARAAPAPRWVSGSRGHAARDPHLLSNRFGFASRTCYAGLPGRSAFFPGLRGLQGRPRLGLPARTSERPAELRFPRDAGPMGLSVDGTW